MTAQPGHRVAPAKAGTHAIGASSHQETTGNNKGTPEADLKAPREHLNVIIWAFALVLQEGMSRNPVVPPAIKEPSRGALCRTFQGMKAPGNSMPRPLPTLNQPPWEDTTALLSAGSTTTCDSEHQWKK